MRITPVYDGRATITFRELAFNKKVHYYTVDVPGVCEGLRQPSVTTILGAKSKPALVPWAVNTVAERAIELIDGQRILTRNTVKQLISGAKGEVLARKEDAANVGSVAHAVLEKALLSEPYTFPLKELPPGFSSEMLKQANNSIAAGLEFIQRHSIEVIQAEAPRWSPTHGYIGTGDLIANIDGELSVLDWKTSKSIYPEHFIQTAAYQAAYQEEFPKQSVKKRVLVNVGRDGELTDRVRRNDTFASDFETFLALRRVWQWTQENEPVWNHKTRSYEIRPAPRIIGPLPTGEN